MGHPKRFIFYTGDTFEKWDYRNPETKGIGGSETAIIELAWRLASRKHEVIVYAPIPSDTETFWKNTTWLPNTDVSYSMPGVWIACRAWDLIDKVKGQKIYLQMQDVVYPKMSQQQAESYTGLLALCSTHEVYVRNKYPKAKIIKSANGIPTDKISGLQEPPRDLHRLVYASSPDRGLVNLLKMFPRIRERVKDASLHIFYGFDNLEKIVDRKTPIDDLGTTISELYGLMAQPGVEWHGRTPQTKLYQEYLKSGVWAYPTRFAETGCITSMEAEACGAIPVTNPFWALKDNVKFGSLIEGDPSVNPMTAERYIDEIVYWLTNEYPDVRFEMMKFAREKFNWEKIVDQYENL